MNTNETIGLQRYKEYGILKKIINFFKNSILKRKQNIKFYSNVSGTNNNISSGNFLNSIKFTEDPDIEILKKIQVDLERNGINKKNAYILTRNLSDVQRTKLLDLYKTQISTLNLNISNCKNKIIKIKNNMS